MKLTSTLLSILADGRFHSGTELGQATGRTRSAVWKAIHKLQSKNIDIYSVRGKGYRLTEPVELLDRNKILSTLDPLARKYLQQLDVQFILDSTNTYLLEVARQGAMSGYICLTEQQRAGRGRRGKSWVSPFGANLYLSLLWRFPFGAGQLSGLSLAIAVALIRAMRELGLVSVGVKWPNDIIQSGRKLAGILLEMSGEASGPCSVVIGIGLNIKKNPVMDTIEQPWTDLESELGRPVVRNDLAAQIINHLMEVVTQFEREGLVPFLDTWREMDIYEGKEIELHFPDKKIQGIARGVDETGALLVDQGNEVRRYQSGDMSLRFASDRNQTEST